MSRSAPHWSRRASIDREARSVLLRLELPRYVPESVLNTAASELSKLYGMRRVRFEPHYPPEALAEFDGQELTRALIDVYSPAAAILAGCKWSFAGERAELYLRANGSDQLTPRSGFWRSASASAWAST